MTFDKWQRDGAQSGDEAETRGLAEVMAEVAQTLHEPESLDDVLNRLVAMARDTIPAQFVGVTIYTKDGVGTAAATDDVVRVLDRAQYELREGPCLEAAHRHTDIAAEDLRSDPRWPRFTPRAVSAGIGSQMGFEILRHGSTFATLNLYSSRPYAFGESTRHAAALFVRHAGLALETAMKISQLHAALETRQLIGQATGILMQRYTLDEDQAFHYLARVSQNSNRKLRDVAAAVVDEVIQRGESARAATRRGGAQTADLAPSLRP